MTISVSSDYLYWDQTEAVTVTLLDRATAITASIAIACRGQVKQKDILGNPEVTTESVVWLIPAALLTDNVMYSGDIITDSGSKKYKVLNVMTRQSGPSVSHYRCVCQKVMG